MHCASPETANKYSLAPGSAAAAGNKHQNHPTEAPHNHHNQSPVPWLSHAFWARWHWFPVSFCCCSRRLEQGSHQKVFTRNKSWFCFFPGEGRESSSSLLWSRQFQQSQSTILTRAGQLYIERRESDQRNTWLGPFQVIKIQNWSAPNSGVCVFVYWPTKPFLGLRSLRKHSRISRYAWLCLACTYPLIRVNRLAAKIKTAQHRNQLFPTASPNDVVLRSAKVKDLL